MNSRRATIIAYYRETKPDPLRAYIAEFQDRARSRISSFVAKPLDDVHATIIGLDSYGQVASDRDAVDVVNSSEWSNLPALCGYLDASISNNPLVVQFGGFADRDYPMSSRGKRLFVRTVTVHSDQMMLLGWVISSEGVPTDLLDRLRRGAQQFGATHKYHMQPEDKDPDVYMVVGTVGDLSDLQNIAVDDLRMALASRPCRTPLNAEAVQVATYIDINLPALSTRTWPLADFARQELRRS